MEAICGGDLWRNGSRQHLNEKNDYGGENGS